MKNREIVERLTDEGVVIFDDPSYEGALIGITWEGQAICDFSRMVDSLMKEGWDEESAIDFISYNYCYNSGEGYPIIADIII